MKKNDLQAGFTLLEIIVVIFIINIGLISILSLANTSIQASRISREKLLAIQLAQEGLELVRNVRDNNYHVGQSWIGTSTDSGSDIIQDNLYSIDFVGITNVEDINDDLARLYLDEDNLYRHYSSPDNATSTAFSRVINIKSQTVASTTVECQIRWQEAGRTHDYLLETNLYDWN